MAKNVQNAISTVSDKKTVNRQFTMNNMHQKGVDGYQVSLTDVMSIGTKHRASFTPTQLSNDPHMNSQFNVDLKQPTETSQSPIALQQMLK